MLALTQCEVPSSQRVIFREAALMARPSKQAGSTFLADPDLWCVAITCCGYATNPPDAPSTALIALLQQWQELLPRFQQSFQSLLHLVQAVQLLGCLQVNSGSV